MLKKPRPYPWGKKLIYMTKQVKHVKIILILISLDL